MGPADRWPWNVLGVEPDATETEIRRAFHSKAREVHPDLAGPDSKARFQALQEAYNAALEPGRESRRKETDAASEARRNPHFEAFARDVASAVTDRAEEHLRGFVRDRILRNEAGAGRVRRAAHGFADELLSEAADYLRGRVRGS